MCADTDEEAEKLAISQDLQLLRIEKGLDSKFLLMMKQHPMLILILIEKKSGKTGIV
ncbi:hypothetical protein [Metabacillus sp. RGM 3146]|uniref:hypothetical protein n=1 Tax=Metabacillus sp. RGM 3146 TaxID=3401092 RepID=UPI003B9A2F93